MSSAISQPSKYFEQTSDTHKEFERLSRELKALHEKRSNIHHDERCGEEEVFYGEGGVRDTEFACYCDYEQQLGKANREISELEKQASDFADAHQIYTRDALHIHERAGDIKRRYTVAQSLGLVELQLNLLEKLKQFEEGAALAMQHDKFTLAIRFLEHLNDFPRMLRYAQEKGQDGVVLKTLLQMDDVEGALRHAESKAMHHDSLEILCSKKRIDEAVSYAQKYNLHQKSVEILRSRQRIDDAVSYAEKYHLHDQAIEMLANQNRFEALFEYGAKHGFLGEVKKKANRRLEELLGRDHTHNHSNWIHHQGVPFEVEKVTSMAREICTAMQAHQLHTSAALYREVIDEFEKRMRTKDLIKEYEKKIEHGDRLWFTIANLELSLGNYARYTKIWKKTKELQEQRMRRMPSDLWGVRYDADIEASNKGTAALVSHAQSMIDHPQYDSQYAEGDALLPKLRYPAQQLLKVAMPLAELLETENENKNGEKKYPFLSLESVIEAWGAAGMEVFLGLDTFVGSRDYADSPRCLQLSQLLGNLSLSLKTVTSPEAFTFLVYHYPHLSQINFGDKINDQMFMKGSGYKVFNRLGWFLEYILEETADDGESAVQKKIALENLLYVPVKKLTKENIFSLETGGPDAVWKHIVEGSIVERNDAPGESDAHGKKQVEAPFIDQRLREIQQMYPYFDETARKRMKQLFFDAYTSSQMTKNMDRALTFYMELKQAYGKPMIFPADHPFHFLRALPEDEKEKKVYAERVMKEIYSVPSRRKQVAEAVLERKLPEFFEEVFRLDGIKTERFSKKLTEFLAASQQQLEVYLQALKSTLGTPALFFELDAAPKGEHESLPKWTFLKHYDHFAAALLAQRSSLFIPKIMAQYVVTTARPQGKRSGITQRIHREVDAISYLFKEIYQIAQSQTFKEEADFRQEAVRFVVELWKRKQKEFLPPEVAQTLANFNFNRFFWKEEEIQRYLETVRKSPAGIDSLFADRPDILFSHILDPGYYLKMKQEGNKEGNNEKNRLELSDDFINAINRLKNGLTTSWTFDELRCEFNENSLRDFFNNAAECTGNGGKYQRYGYAHRQDKNIGIIAANLYETGKYKSTVGKAFLARCLDKDKKELLYVDGVVMLQDIADFLEEPNQEARWLALYTKAILQTAQTHQLDEVVFNASHKLAQRSVWQYIRHIATLFGLEEGKEKDFTYGEGKVDDGDKGNGVDVKTRSCDGFELRDVTVQKNYHYLEKVQDDSYLGNHLLEGFWINHYDPAQAQDDALRLPPFVTPIDHSNTPPINDGKGYIIGFRVKTKELARRFNEKYGPVFGEVSQRSL